MDCVLTRSMFVVLSTSDLRRHLSDPEKDYWGPSASCKETEPLKLEHFKHCTPVQCAISVQTVLYVYHTVIITFDVTIAT